MRGKVHTVLSGCVGGSPVKDAVVVVVAAVAAAPEEVGVVVERTALRTARRRYGGRQVVGL
jgi:hypothetical protein